MPGRLLPQCTLCLCSIIYLNLFSLLFKATSSTPVGVSTPDDEQVNNKIYFSKNITLSFPQCLSSYYQILWLQLSKVYFEFTHAPVQFVQTSTPVDMPTPKNDKRVNNKSCYKKFRFKFSSVHNFSLSSRVSCDRTFLYIFILFSLHFKMYNLHQLKCHYY